MLGKNLNASKEIYDKLWSTCCDKNPYMIKGFSYITYPLYTEKDDLDSLYYISTEGKLLKIGLDTVCTITNKIIRRIEND